MTYRGSASGNGADKFSSIPSVVILYLGIRDETVELQIDRIYMDNTCSKYNGIMWEHYGKLRKEK